MQVSQAIAQRIKEVYFGGSWTTASVKEFFSGLSLKEANMILNDGNTIYTILHHCHYYTLVQKNVLLSKSPDVISICELTGTFNFFGDRTKQRM